MSRERPSGNLTRVGIKFRMSASLKNGRASTAKLFIRMKDDKALRRAEIAEMLRGVARRHVRAPGRVFVFGSQANRATMKRADIDIGVDVGRKLDSAEYFALLDDFAALPMLYPVDLVDFAAVDADFRRLAESDIELLT